MIINKKQMSNNGHPFVILDALLIFDIYCQSKIYEKDVYKLNMKVIYHKLEVICSLPQI